MPSSSEPLAPALLVRRVPPGLTAGLVLLVCAAAALNLYWHPGPTLRLLSLVLGVLALGAAVVTMRTALVADAGGVTVRFLGAPRRVPWEQVQGFEVVAGVRGSATVRVLRTVGPPVDVPPSLLQPARPTTLPVALARLRALAADLESMRVAAARRDG